LHKDAKGVWRVELQVSPGGQEYRLIVDDQWQDDPHAASFIPNPFGSRNCFVQVA
jgi:1,4-alpha-glucan branching enzyme